MFEGRGLVKEAQLMEASPEPLPGGVHACPALRDPRDCSPPGSAVHGISQARLLGWDAISFSRGSSPPRDGIPIFCIGRRVLYHGATEG